MIHINVEFHTISPDQLAILALRLGTAVKLIAHPYQLALIEAGSFNAQTFGEAERKRGLIAFPLESRLDVPRDSIIFVDIDGYEIARLVNLET